MNRVLRTVISLPGILFLVLGLRWLVDPAGAGEALGMTLLAGAGLSTKIGDLAAFFLTMGLCILTAAATGKRAWLYAPVMLLGFTAVSRTIAWLFHDAAFTPQMIAVELILACLLAFAATRLQEAD